MTLNEMICQRKSCRSFTGKPVDAEMIEKILSFKPRALYPDIKIRMDIVSRDAVKCICPWTTPQLITVYSEEADGYLENIGFLFQQMDLYLQTLGLGVCWLGMGRMNPRTAPEVEGMKFVIMMAFGYPKGDQLRHDLKGFKRKSMEKISDRGDPRLEPARLAPSAVNSQPWYFTHDGDVIHVCCSQKGSRLDAGIALAHLYVANEETFRFFKTENAPQVPGYGYIGSIVL
ncbi:MAG: nitroreductase [Oscillospiraceae bacterium]|nr:nitroreductase [Oscillospiraceae bacterium]